MTADQLFARARNLPLVLASASPRRRQLLASMGVSFTCLSTDTDESQLSGEAPKEFVLRLAEDKAKAATALLSDSALVLAADTIVVQSNTVFGKPTDFADAQRMWRSLRNTQHQVMTGVCLLVHDKLSHQSPLVAGCRSVVDITTVVFGEITDQQMQAYWESAEPLDKAGAYAIQGLASAWVQQINGSYSNVVGLPLCAVNQLLQTVEKNWL